MRAGIVLSTVLASLASIPVAAGGGYGHVEFANSGAPAAQADFVDGLALLHDFEYDAAAAAFRRAEVADPGFAMAYWGEAMTYTHPVWMQQDLQGARGALGKLASSPAARLAKANTERERAYLSAVETLYGEGTKADRDLRYEAEMARLHERYPGDVDATAFYGLSILGTAHGGRDYSTYMRAAGVLEDAWVDHHEHPGLVHYLIHCYDDPVHAPLGLRAARIYARIAPDAGHAQHMTSHIFLALGDWQRTVEANIAAIEAVNRQRRVAGRAELACGHYPSWLEYAYLQLGQIDPARNVLDACRRAVLASATKDRVSQELDPDASLTGSFANMTLRYLIDAEDGSATTADAVAEKTAGPGAQLDLAAARTFGAIARGDVTAAPSLMHELDAAAQRVVDIETRAGDPDPSYRVRAAILKLEAQGLLAEKKHELVGAERALRQAAAQEDALPIAFGPPLIDKPPHELLGEFLLRRGQYPQAREQFLQALARTPGRRLARTGLDAASSAAAKAAAKTD